MQEAKKNPAPYRQPPKNIQTHTHTEKAIHIKGREYKQTPALGSYASGRKKPLNSCG
jgi:hypothetical protein